MKSTSINYCSACLKDFTQGGTVNFVPIDNNCICSDCLPKIVPTETEERTYSNVPMIQKGRFKATYHNEKSAIIDGLRVFRHESGAIAFDINGQLTSVNDDPSSKSGNPNLYNKLDEVLRELGI